MASIIPPSITLIACISRQLAVLEPLLTPKSAAAKSFKSMVLAEGDLAKTQQFTENAVYLRHLQTLLLLGLSMHGGLFIPSLSGFAEVKDGVSLHWDGGIRFHMRFGQFDDDFLTFADFFQSKVFGVRHSERLPGSIVNGIYQAILTYSDLLTVVLNRLNLLLNANDKTDFLTHFSEELNRDLYFIMLSCLPSAQVNALFLYLAQHLPDDLSVSLPNGLDVQATAYFEQPGTDLRFLIEKIIVYLGLYYDTSTPIIQEITRLKTHDYLVTMLQNRSVFEQSLRHLAAMKSQQIDVRLNLYSLFIPHLEALFRS